MSEPDRQKVIEGLVEIVHFFDILSEISSPCNELKQDAENAIAFLKEQEGYVSVPFSWLVKFCTHIDFNEPMRDANREKLWKQKLKQQFNIDIPLKE